MCSFKSNAGRCEKYKNLVYLLYEWLHQGFSMHDEDVHLQHDNRGIQVDFVFGRRFLNHGLTEFLPPIIICVVSFCTCYFKVGTLKYSEQNIIWGLG